MEKVISKANPMHFIRNILKLLPYRFQKKFKEALGNLNQSEVAYIEIKNKATESNFQKRAYASILALKGYVLEQLKQTEKAQQAYEQTLVINPCSLK